MSVPVNSILHPRKPHAIIDQSCRLLHVQDSLACLIELRPRQRLQDPFLLSWQKLQEQVDDGTILADSHFPTGVPSSIELLGAGGMKRYHALLPHFEPLFASEVQRRAMLFDSGHRRTVLLRLARTLPNSRMEFNIDPTVKVNKTGMSFEQTRLLFNQVLWSGFSLIVLGAQYRRCGAKGSPQQAITRKGKPARRRGRQKVGGSSVALPVVAKVLTKGAKLYYFKRGYTFLKAYWMVIRGTWPESLREYTNEYGLWCCELIDPEQVPSKGQFRTIIEQLKAKGLRHNIKPNRRGCEQSPRESRGSPKNFISMVGERIEMDATKAQFRTVLTFNRARKIKSLTAYIAVCCFSELICGWVITAQPPCLAVALQLIESCRKPKGPEFKRLGLPYTDKDCPVILGSLFSVDRGEMVASKVSHIVVGGMVIEVMPSMMAHMKGVVENRWDQIKEGQRRSGAPGAHSKKLERREDDGWDEAYQTPVEQEREFVRVLMGLNFLPPTRLPPDMLEPGMKIVSRVQLAHWGLKYRGGRTRTLSEKEAIDHLWMRGTASVTKRGLYFERQTYVHDRLHDLRWTRRAARGESFDVEVRYQENLADWVLFLDPEADKWVAAHLDNPELLDRKLTYWELEAWNEDEKAVRESTRDSAALQMIAGDAETERLRQEAREKAEKARLASGRGIRSSKDDVHANTALEVERERLQREEEHFASHVSGIAATRNAGTKPAKPKKPKAAPEAMVDDESEVEQEDAELTAASADILEKLRGRNEPQS